MPVDREDLVTIKQRLARWVLGIFNWRLVGDVPEPRRFVIFGGPHTSNWDFPLAMLAVRGFGIKVSFIGKHTLFRWPFGYFFRWLGGIPVDRSKPGGLVQQVVDAIERSERMILVMAPEGTRTAAPFWKSGFLQIAARAEVPIVLGYVDFANRLAGLGPLLRFDGGVTRFMDQARRLYSEKQG